MQVNVTVTDHGAVNPEFTDRDIARIAAREVQHTFRQHFTDQSMAKQSRWWGKAASATRMEASSHDGFTVIVDQPGVALHYYGGVVHPVEKELLAVPNDAITDAHGKSPLEFGNLRMVIFPHLCGPSGHLAGMLVPEVASTADRALFKQKGQKTARQFGMTRVRDKKQTVVPYYWLMTETQHEPDETVLPSDDTIDDNIESVLTGVKVEVEK